MTLYYSLVFALLVFEMVLFVALIIPLPHSLKRKMFNFISESVIVAKLQYGLKVCTTSVSHEQMKLTLADNVHIHNDPVHRQRQSRLQGADWDGGLWQRKQRSCVSSTFILKVLPNPVQSRHSLSLVYYHVPLCRVTLFSKYERNYLTSLRV